MKTRSVILGLSVNPEVVVTGDSSNGGEKHPLQSLRVDFSGSAANVGIALKQLGCYPMVFGLTGKNGDETMFLEWALKKARGVVFTAVEALDHTSIAVLSVDQAKPTASRVVGRKGNVLSEKVDEAVSQIRENVASIASWRVAVGVRESEILLAEALLFEATPGTRVLSPHRSFCEGQSRTALFQVLKSVDLFILNELEFSGLGMASPCDLHQYGPSLVVVTKDERGGCFSLRREGGTFDAVKYTESGYPTGAGDWFLGALVSELVSRELVLTDIKRPALEECLAFAAKVAGKKVTMPGGGKGPTRLELVT